LAAVTIAESQGIAGRASRAGNTPRDHHFEGFRVLVDNEQGRPAAELEVALRQKIVENFPDFFGQRKRFKSGFQNINEDFLVTPPGGKQRAFRPFLLPCCLLHTLYLLRMIVNI
jgi:hypothetical protein